MFVFAGIYKSNQACRTKEKQPSSTLEYQPIRFICGKPNKKLLYTHDKTKVIFISKKEKKIILTNQ